MSKIGVDYYALSLEDIKSTGATFVIRYLSLTPGKILERSEAEQLSKAGLEIVLVWETDSRRPIEGYEAGQEDARTASQQAKECGMPDNRPIYFAVDIDTSLDVTPILPYFQGVHSVLPVNRIGVYGGITTVKYLFDEKLIGFAWQTSAWSEGQWEPRAQIRQVQYTSKGYDVDEAVQDDFGQFKL